MKDIAKLDLFNLSGIGSGLMEELNFELGGPADHTNEVMFQYYVKLDHTALENNSYNRDGSFLLL